MGRNGLIVLLALGLALGPLPAARAQPAGGATLTLLAGRAEVAPPNGAFAPAADGQTVPVGARVRTGPDGRAVLTFFDGSTATLDPATELTIQRIEPSGGQGGLLLGIGLAVGRVWAQVTALVERGSSFEVQAGGTTAVAREGVVGFRLDPDGAVTCWVLAGAPLRLRTSAGDLALAPGFEVRLAPGEAPARPRPRAFGPGLLEITTEGSVLPRLVSPDERTVGFPLADLVVNQVLDATTSAPDAAPRWLRVPSPAPGVHRLVLQSFEGGPYRARVRVAAADRDLLVHEWTGTLAPGAGQVVEIMIAGDSYGPTAADLSAPVPLAGEPPGRFVYP